MRILFFYCNCPMMRRRWHNCKYAVEMCNRWVSMKVWAFNVHLIVPFEFLKLRRLAIIFDNLLLWFRMIFYAMLAFKLLFIIQINRVQFIHISGLTVKLFLLLIQLIELKFQILLIIASTAEYEHALAENDRFDLLLQFYCSHFRGHFLFYGVCAVVWYAIVKPYPKFT